MKTWIVSCVDEVTIQGKETILGRKLYEEIRYVDMAFFKETSAKENIVPYSWSMQPNNQEFGLLGRKQVLKNLQPTNSRYLGYSP